MPSQFSQTMRAFATDRPRHAHIAWMISGTCLCIWCAWLFLAPVTVYETSQSARLEVMTASHQVDSLVAGEIASTSMTMGKEVQAGDVLLELDTTREKLQQTEQEAHLAAITTRMESLRREVEARETAKAEDLAAAKAAIDAARARNDEASVAVNFAGKAEKRVGKLVASGTSSKVEGQKATAERQKLQAAQAALAAEITRIERDAQSRDFQNQAEIENLKYDLATLSGEYTSTQAAISRLSYEIDNHLVRAPLGGKLADVLPFHAGAYVAEGQHLAVIVPAGALQIVAEFAPSPTLGRVQPGQTAQLRLDGFPWAQYGVLPATVRRVAGEVRDDLIRVELSLDAGSESAVKLQHGLPGLVEVSIETVSPATLLLRSAGLLLQDKPHAAVHVAQVQP